MSEPIDGLQPDSRAIHADRAANDTDAVVPPIWLTSTFWADSDEAFLSKATTPGCDHFYTRTGNPNQTQAALVVAALEGAESAVVAGSGMGAITSTILAFAGSGDHIVAQQNLYAGTTSFLKGLAPKLGIASTVVDQRDPDAFAAAIQPSTRLLMLETPSNPLLRITDLRAVADLARGHGIVAVVDNTFATPINQRPIEFGIDIVVHSATKYLGGHSDLIAGVTAGRREHVERVAAVMSETGAILGPFESWLLLRGLRSLPVRVERHNRNGLSVARFFEEHSSVAAVHYPGLEAHPQRELARSQMSGFGGMVSVEFKGGHAAASRFVNSVQMARRAASLGGVESLVAHPASMWAKTLDADQMAAMGIRPGLVRISIGLEDDRDLRSDFDRALQHVDGASERRSAS